MSKMVGYKWQNVPQWITEGNHAQFILPVAQKVLTDSTGEPLTCGIDVGCKKVEWAYPGAIPVDPALDPEYDANWFPDVDGDLEFIFSSHCLEHISSPLATLQYWHTQLAWGGYVFLYLPHPDCLYWQPREMRDGIHKHQPTPKLIHELLNYVGFKNVEVSERNLAYSFAAYGRKVR